MLLVGIAVTLPFSLASVLDEILGLTTGKVLPLLRPERRRARAGPQPPASGGDRNRRGPPARDTSPVGPPHLRRPLPMERPAPVRLRPAGRGRRGRPASLGEHHAARNHRGRYRDLSAPAPRRADPVSVRRVPSDRGGGPAACSPGRPRREPGGRPDHAPSRAHAPGAASSPAHVGPRWGRHRVPPGARRSRRVRRRIRPRLRAAPLPPGPGRSARAVDRRRRGLLGVPAAARGSRGQLRRARPRHLGSPRASSCRSISIFRRQSISRFPSSFSSCSEVSR